MANSILGNAKGINQMNAFNQFRANYRGNPKQEVMQMLQSGMINDQQLQQAINQARQLRNSVLTF